MKSEPVLVICGALGAVVTATVSLVVAFGIKVTPDQAAGIIGEVAVLTQIITALVSRTQVTPTQPAVTVTHIDAAPLVTPAPPVAQ